MQVFCLADSNKRQHCGDINFFSETLWAQKSKGGAETNSEKKRLMSIELQILALYTVYLVTALLVDNYQATIKR